MQIELLDKMATKRGILVVLEGYDVQHTFDSHCIYICRISVRKIHNFFGGVCSADVTDAVRVRSASALRTS